ncbi:MAG: phosphoribosylanthranilate isomerase [Aquificae bacterium]|nr:phosphoribosylanthranilate isomerase [Aquificota bacterium]
MFIKICGITKPEQAYEISKYGATHIGVIFYEKSPRHISLDQIKDIKNTLPKPTKLVAVTVNPDISTVDKLLKTVDLVQFHGDETIQFIKNFPKEKVIKAFRLGSQKELSKIKKFSEEGYLILVDSYSKEAYGGTGKQIKDSILRHLKDTIQKFVLSGGLSEENIEKMITSVKPYGVDASSKLEISPGVKNLEKVKKFIKIAKYKLGDLDR